MSLAVKKAPRVGAERFESLYASSPDPWGYCTSSYEHEKYADTLAALPLRPLGSALEVGCSIGVFTRQLAMRCERVLGIDFSPRALALARARVSGLTNVQLRQASFPEQVPEELPGSGRALPSDELAFRTAPEGNVCRGGQLARRGI